MHARGRLLAAFVLALGAIAMTPYAREILRLRPSGDIADQILLLPGSTLTQEIRIPHASSFRSLELLLRPPVPNSGTLVVRARHGQEEQTVETPLSRANSDGRLRIPVRAVLLQENAVLTLTAELRGTSVPLALATATGIPDTLATTLRVDDELQDRSLALELRTREFLGVRFARSLGDGVRDLGTGTIALLLLGVLIGVAAHGLARSDIPVRRFGLCLALAGLIAIVLHEPFRVSYPATNDEGSILADARNLSPEFWPLQTGGAKGPLALLVLLPVVRVADNPLLAARSLVTLLTALEVVLLGILARRLWNERVGILSALLYATTPAVIAQTTQVFLQPFALPFVTLAWIFLLTPPASGIIRLRGSGRSVPAVLLAGVSFALAFLARPTSLAFAPPAMLIALVFSRQSWTTRRQRVAHLVTGFLGTILLASLLVLPALGLSKTADLLGWQGFLVSQHRADRGLSMPGLSLLKTFPRSLIEVDAAVQQARPLLVGALPLLICSAAFLLRNSVMLLRISPRALPLLFSAAGVGLLLLLLRQSAIAGSFSLRVLMIGGSLASFPLMAVPRSSTETRPRTARDLFLLTMTWILLVIGYANYGRFRSHYHAEFLPLYVLASAVMLASVLPQQRGDSVLLERFRVPRGSGILFSLVALVLTLSFPSALQRHHAGNIPLPVVDEVVADLKERTAPGDQVFTAQVLFPVLASRRIPYGIAHPGWYREEVLGTLPPGLRKQYYPDRETLRAHLERTPVRVAVIERRTREVFLEFDPALRELLSREYALARTIPNSLLDAIEIWQRKNIP